MSNNYEPITELEQILLLAGLSRLKLAKIDKDGAIKVGPAESQFVTTLDTVERVVLALSKMIPEQTNVFGEVLERKALRCCTGYLRTLIFSLTMKTLPEYDQRMRKASNDVILKSKIMSYIIACKDKLEIATKLLNRMERCL